MIIVSTRNITLRSTRVHEESEIASFQSGLQVGRRLLKKGIMASIPSDRHHSSTADAAAVLNNPGLAMHVDDISS